MVIPSIQPFYDWLSSAGVNAEWCSIATVIFALLPILTIWLVVGRIFKGKK